MSVRDPDSGSLLVPDGLKILYLKILYLAVSYLSSELRYLNSWPKLGHRKICPSTIVKFLKKFRFGSLYERKWLFSRENRPGGISRILLSVVLTRNKTRRPRSHGCHPRKWWNLSNHRRKSFQRGFRKTRAISHAFLWYVRLLWSVKGLKLSIYRKFWFSKYSEIVQTLD